MCVFVRCVAVCVCMWLCVLVFGDERARQCSERSFIACLRNVFATGRLFVDPVSRATKSQQIPLKDQRKNLELIAGENLWSNFLDSGVLVIHLGWIIILVLICALGDFGDFLGFLSGVSILVIGIIQFW